MSRRILRGDIFIYDDDEGDAGVCDSTVPAPIVIHSPVLLSARVAINIDGVELARLAAFLDERCEADVARSRGASGREGVAPDEGFDARRRYRGRRPDDSRQRAARHHLLMVWGRSN